MSLSVVFQMIFVVAKLLDVISNSSCGKLSWLKKKSSFLLGPHPLLRPGWLYRLSISTHVVKPSRDVGDADLSFLMARLTNMNFQKIIQKNIDQCKMIPNCKFLVFQIFI